MASQASQERLPRLDQAALAPFNIVATAEPFTNFIKNFTEPDEDKSIVTRDAYWYRGIWTPMCWNQEGMERFLDDACRAYSDQDLFGDYKPRVVEENDPDRELSGKTLDSEKPFGLMDPLSPLSNLPKFVEIGPDGGPIFSCEANGFCPEPNRVPFELQDKLRFLKGMFYVEQGHEVPEFEFVGGARGMSICYHRRFWLAQGRRPTSGGGLLKPWVPMPVDMVLLKNAAIIACNHGSPHVLRVGDWTQVPEEFWQGIAARFGWTGDFTLDALTSVIFG